MTNIDKLSIRELASSIDAGDLRREEVLRHFTAKIESLDSEINAFCHSPSDAADSIADAPTTGILNGVPVAIKDNICTSGTRTSACSSMLSEFVPPYEATVVQRLRAAGAVPTGKTNLDEFAMGSSTENSFFGATKNPWDLNRVPGGSSGGSAAAVAAGMVPLALGSDTGGSIRQPAAFCGISGLKPTYGLVSRLGLLAFASSLDQVGPMGRSAEDLAVAMNVLAGHDPGDSTSIDRAVPDYVAGLEQQIAGCRIGVCRSQLDENVQPEIVAAVEAAIKTYKELGAKIVDIELAHQKYSVATYYVIAPCEASSNLSRYDGVRYTKRADTDQLNSMYTQTRSEHLGDEVKRRILLGTYALSSGYYDEYYLKASKVRRLIKQDFEQAFEKVDLIAGPTTPTTAFPIGERTSDPIKMYLADVFTVSANLAGIPAMSIPCGFADGLPMGLQLQGPAFSECRMLSAAHHYQQQTDWHLRRPS